MSKSEQVPAAVEAVQDLQSQVTTPEDQLVLNGWKKEVGKERARALAEMGERHDRSASYTEAAGTVVPADDVAAERARGRDVSNSSYNAGAHSSH